MTSHSLKILPLGGLGEIGLNMMVLECEGECLIIDCGLMFPDTQSLGVDVVIPDYKSILQKNIKAIVITHGHEDHIGALPFFLQDVQKPIPIYAPRFARELILQKLKGAHDKHVKVKTVKDGDKVDVGVFEVEFVETVHSIIDSMALFIKTPVGHIFHTGDFKFDPYKKKHKEKIKKIGKQGIHLLFADSTNVEREGASLSEEEIKKNFDKIIAKEKGRVFISSFASNLRRISYLLDLAKKHKRRVFLDGRSMLSNTQIARELGILKSTDIITDNPQEDNLIFIITGSQAEPYASLTRLAYRSHAHIKLKEGDLVILSSRFIPGNERAIHKLLNHVCEQGARVLYGDISDIHTSGHAHRKELKLLHKMIKPRFFIPVHGEYRHLTMHQALAKEVNPRVHSVIAQDGDVIEASKNSLKKIDHIEVSHVFVDSIAGDDLENTILKERRNLSEKGIIFVVVIRNEKTGEVIEGPHLYAKGFLSQKKHEELFEEAKKVAFKYLKQEKSIEELQEEIRIGVRRFFKSRELKRPLVLPIILDI
ncbi:MAG: ribonuclease J [Deltaproteobacteria bacterium]|nr:ribonuclease J [Deltaproteobacteria bacterium]